MSRRIGRGAVSVTIQLGKRVWLKLNRIGQEEGVNAWDSCHAQSSSRLPQAFGDET